MSSFKLTFKLKQHTPIIHFQHDETGATLRATELKPKLDKFLIETLQMTEIIKDKNGKDQKVPKAKYKSWFINEGKEHLALDYKVRVENVKDNNGKGKLENYYFESRIKEDLKNKVKREIERNTGIQDLIIVAPSPFFANNDKRGNRKYNEILFGLKWTGLIKVEILVFNKNLKEEIKNRFDLFISTHNFGTRQNKGFGCYSNIDLNVNVFENYLKTNFDFYKKVRYNSKNIFKDIDNIYKKLKNNPGQDVSKIRDFFLEKDIEWEKKFVTKKIVNNQNYSKDRIRYVRILLGLAELHDYQQFGKKVKIKHVNKEIDRFQSPILFKVFDKNIYLVANDVDFSKILDEKFWFYIGDSIEKAKVKEQLQVPSEFNLVEFLKDSLL